MAVSKKVYNLAKACWDKWGDEAGGLPDEKADYVFGMGKKQGWLNLSKPDELVDILNALEDFAEGNEVIMTSANPTDDVTPVVLLITDEVGKVDEVTSRTDMSWGDLNQLVNDVMSKMITNWLSFTAYDITVQCRNDNPDKEIEHTKVKDIIRSRMELEPDWSNLVNHSIPGNPVQYQYWPIGRQPIPWVTR